jgi:hypothetical protein
MPLWSSVFYLHTPLAGHPVPNSRIHTYNEYMMNHPQQLLAVFLSDIWKIQIYYTINYFSNMHSSQSIWQIKFVTSCQLDYHKELGWFSMLPMPVT